MEAEYLKSDPLLLAPAFPPRFLEFTSIPTILAPVEYFFWQYLHHTVSCNCLWPCDSMSNGPQRTFCLQSTTPSHAVGANVQKVLAMMKSHNLALCSSFYNGHGGCNGEAGRSHSPSLSSSSSVSLDQDLADLLAQLQDEFGQLSLWVIFIV